MDVSELVPGLVVVHAPDGSELCRMTSGTALQLNDMLTEAIEPAMDRLALEGGEKGIPDVVIDIPGQGTKTMGLAFAFALRDSVLRALKGRIGERLEELAQAEEARREAGYSPRASVGVLELDAAGEPVGVQTTYRY